MNTVNENCWLIYAAATVMTFSCRELFSVTEFHLKQALRLCPVDRNDTAPLMSFVYRVF